MPEIDAGDKVSRPREQLRRLLELVDQTGTDT
jgi:hypothetical protein